MMDMNADSPLHVPVIEDVYLKWDHRARWRIGVRALLRSRPASIVQAG